MTYLFMIALLLWSRAIIHIFYSAGIILKCNILLVYIIFQLDNKNTRTEKISQCPSQQNLHLEGAQYDFMTRSYY